MRRRLMLARALCAGAAWVAPGRVQAPVQCPPMAPGAPAAARFVAPVPSGSVTLAAFGGVPGAGRAALADAFARAFAALALLGGGTLRVAPGVYDAGPIDDAASIVVCRDLHDIAIAAHGATFMLTTRARVVPNFFYFVNFRNVSLAGASFIDHGFDPRVDWRGMICVGAQADRPSRDLVLSDCHARQVVSLFASHNAAAGRHLMSGIRIQGAVRDAYYGVGASFIRDGVVVDLVCRNVRRAFIASALRGARISAQVTNCAGWPGSNGLVALICGGSGSGDVEDVRVLVSLDGPGILDSVVHFYHQGLEPTGAMRDIDATVHLAGAAGARNLFMFDHEADLVLPSTARVWDRIALHGSLAGPFAGNVLANPSRSRAPGLVELDRNLAAMADLDRLGARFREAAP